MMEASSGFKGRAKMGADIRTLAAAEFAIAAPVTYF